MNRTVLPPNVHLSVAVVRYHGRILLTWNPRWGSFSLPMSKIRQWPMPGGHLEPDSETGLQAAVRAAAESLGRPLDVSEIKPEALPLELQPYDHRSHRDGQWKRYGREVYLFELQRDGVPHGTASQAWIELDQLARLQPISPTVLEVLNAAQTFLESSN